MCKFKIKISGFENLLSTAVAVMFICFDLLVIADSVCCVSVRLHVALALAMAQRSRENSGLAFIAAKACSQFSTSPN